MKLIECDVDGILYNISGLAIDNVNKKYGLSLHESGVFLYNYSMWGDEIRNLLIKEFSNPQNCNNHAYIYDDAIDIIKYIDSLGGEIVFRTLVQNEECQKARIDLLEFLLAKVELKSPYKIQAVIGSKPTIDSDVIIEDNPSAILNSKARWKIVRRHPYNAFLFKDNSIIDLHKLIQ